MLLCAVDVVCAARHDFRCHACLRAGLIFRYLRALLRCLRRAPPLFAMVLFMIFAVLLAALRRHAVLPLAYATSVLMRQHAAFEARCRYSTRRRVILRYRYMFKSH